MKQTQFNCPVEATLSLIGGKYIVCADHNKAWVRPFDQKQTGDIDASILTDHMMLQATELGLGAPSAMILATFRNLHKIALFR